MSKQKSRKMNRIAERMMFEAIKKGRYKEASKSMEMQLKINAQNSLFKSKVDDMMQVNITDLPIEVIKKWCDELEAYLMKSPISQEFIENMNTINALEQKRNFNAGYS